MQKPYVPEDKMLLYWGSGYMLLDMEQFHKLSLRKQTQIVTAACKAAERNTKC